MSCLATAVTSTRSYRSIGTIRFHMPNLAAAKAAIATFWLLGTVSREVDGIMATVKAGSAYVGDQWHRERLASCSRRPMPLRWRAWRHWAARIHRRNRLRHPKYRHRCQLHLAATNYQTLWTCQDLVIKRRSELNVPGSGCQDIVGLSSR
jgi:hypothetical protein